MNPGDLGPRAATALLLSGALVALAACSRHTEPPAAAQPAAAPARAASAPATEAADGAPRVALAPDGVHIDYRVYGRGEPLVVLIHGWSCDANYWRAQIEDLKSTYTVVAVNLAGHGGSGRNRTQWTMAAFGADVAAVLGALPDGKVILVGHSMGGQVALEAARLIPDRLLGIVGVDTFQGLGEAPGPDPRMDALIAHMRTDFIGATREFVTTAMFPKDADPLLVRRIADDMALAPPEVAIPSLVALSEYDARPALAQIHVPIVAIRSDLWPEDSARIRRVVPAYRAVVMPGVGHFPMMEDPAGFDALLRREITALAHGGG